jgi:hypothetical protein
MFHVKTWAKELGKNIWFDEKAKKCRTRKLETKVRDKIHGLKVTAMKQLVYILLEDQRPKSSLFKGSFD